jgi:uncharacterized protein (TIGR02246 family)
MKNIISFSFVMIIGLLTINGQTSNPEIEKLKDNYITAVEKSSTDGILKIYSEDAAIRHIDGTVLQGEKEIRDLYNKFFAENKATISFENVSLDKLGDDLIFYHDKVFLDLEGKEDTENLEVVNIAKKIDGKWRVIKSYRWLVSM